MWPLAPALGWHWLHPPSRSGTGRIRILRHRLRAMRRVRPSPNHGLSFPLRVTIGPINLRLKGTIRDNG